MPGLGQDFSIELADVMQSSEGFLGCGLLRAKFFEKTTYVIYCLHACLRLHSKIMLMETSCYAICILMFFMLSMLEQLHHVTTPFPALVCFTIEHYF